MKENDLRRIAGLYFGLVPTPKIPSNADFEIIYPEDISDAEETNLHVKWANHIGAESGVARITPLDVMHYLDFKYTKDNYERAVKILKGIARREGLPLIRLGERYLLVNPKHRR